MDILGIFRKKHYAKRLLEDERRIAQQGGEKERVLLAGDERTSQEILQYMAEHDASDKVRKKLAANPSTPLQVAATLSQDKNPDIRYAMAKRLVTILPSLDEETYSQLYAFVVQSLGMLALDEVLKIRKALAETLKDYAKTPPPIAAQLAKDLEREVAEPILRFCMAVPDKDLMDILKSHPSNWAAEAIAGRKTLSRDVSRAVFDTGNIRAGKILLQNAGAEVSKDLLEEIIIRAREYPEWHKPIAMHKVLSPLMAQKLAAYVDKSVRSVLLARSDLDAQTIAEISAIMLRRMDFEEEKRKSQDKTNPIERAEQMFRRGDLTEEVLSDAVVMRDRDFGYAALALCAGTTIENIKKVFDARAPKSICAVCWKAGFSMKLALKLQQYFGRIPHSALIYPRGGVDYPQSEAELKWQLEIIGIP